MKQAILITAYKNYSHLKKLVDFFDDDFYVFIHLDKKSNINDPIIDEIKANNNVKLFSNEYIVNWASFNHLKAIMLLISSAQKYKEVKYFHLITGHDFPIKTCNYFREFVEQNGEKQFIAHFPLPFEGWTNGGYERFDYYNFHDNFKGTSRIGKRIIMSIVFLQKFFKIKRKIDKNFPALWGGGTWCSFNDECASYLINYTEENKDVYNRFKHTYCAEEMYIHTVVMNSHLKNTVVNDDIRYIDWTLRNNNRPANLDKTDIDYVLKSYKLFARKFEYPISEGLLKEIIDRFSSNIIS